MKRITILLAVFALAANANLFAQTKTTHTMDSVKLKCKDLPMDQRVRVTVARFNVTVPKYTRDLGDNMSTMLQNALQQINCFSVLEGLGNLSDMTGEQQLGQSDLSNGKSAPKKGKMLGAQVIITGEITQMNEKSSGVNVGIVSSGKKGVHMSFVMKAINAETRQIIFSQNFIVEGKAKTSHSFNLGGLHTGSHEEGNPAITDALEQGVLQASEYLASNKDKFQFMDANAGKEGAGAIESKISVSSISYQQCAALKANLKTCKGVSIVEGNWGGSANPTLITVTHTGTQDDLIGNILEKLGSTYVPDRDTEGNIVLKVKQ